MRVRVLEERREKNPVASIILLSDGRDIYNGDNRNQRNKNRNRRSSNPTLVPEYLILLPSSICPCNRQVAEAEDLSTTFLVHTFGFGSDHDSSAMHAISDASGRTFSFIESFVTVQDAFAVCIGGLLSVVAQELHLSCIAASPGVNIVSIPSGRYGKSIKIRRPQVLSPTDVMVSLEVDRQINWLAVAETIQEAQNMAERGDLEGAQALLTNRRSSLLSSASAQAGDGLCNRLDAELTEIGERMASEELCEQMG
ncbi:hypothetical protein K7X08_017261 [Anisodus acutangulus]|uniref:Uncharacterized protein n=1 Tax=Anisodus acutangulus TaxID=402998 RepID=A0A9Q1R7K8_9SOLA|nr:hypothetical protein K7X08_017261 [Anisodus acutangulus]